MNAGACILIAAIAWLLWAEITRRLMRNPRGDAPTGIFWHGIRLYTRLVHRVRASGAEDLRARRDVGPLILVLNHTAGVDPLLVQASCNFEVRWMMASDMRYPSLDELWTFGRIIFVDRVSGGRGDTTGTREAIRHVKGGGVIGIFPEGGIERPARTLRRFHSGVGFLIRRTGAPVLPVIIDGTPAGLPTAWGSLVTTSRSSVRFMDPIDYSQTRLSADEIAADLRHRFHAWTGWPLAPHEAGD